MKESWQHSVLQIIHILCYYDTRYHFPIRNYDKQLQAKAVGYLYKPEKYKFFGRSNLTEKLRTSFFTNNQVIIIILFHEILRISNWKALTLNQFECC